MHGYKIVSYKVHGFYERTQAVDSYFVSQNNCVIFYRFNVESCAHVWSIIKPPSHFYEHFIKNRPKNDCQK
ncbi:hypothetical protein PKHYL_19320 [Psychrobacter sp. KH172YL61]|nr:hypothetical protein PKHYL_19320 [Psychrobacter sp. KH172YL61]